MEKNQNKALPQSRAEQVKTVFVLNLLAKSGQEKPRVYKFDKERIVVGSVTSADVQLTGEGVSPIHAVIEMARDSQSGKLICTIYDLASDTGVFLNNKKIVTERLSENDEIVIGRFRFKYSTEKLDPSRNRERTREVEGRTLFLNPDEDLQPLLLEDEREVIEIFDLRPTSQRALEVVMSWCGMILEVEHFVREKQVTVGHTRKSHFSIPPLLSVRQYPIVSRVKGDFVLNLDSQMQGVIYQTGELKTLNEVRESALQGPQGWQIPIGNKDFAKISIGEIDFYFSSTSAPPRLKRRKIFDRDPFFLKIFTVSMLFTAAAVVALFNIQVPVNVEPEKVPDRIAAILYEPEKFLNPPPVPTPKAPEPEKPKADLEPPKPMPVKTTKVDVLPKVEPKKPIPKTMAVQPVVAEKKVVQPPKPIPPAAKPAAQARSAPKASAQEGEGARAKGHEGSRGEKNAKMVSPNKVTEIARPSPNSNGKGANGDSEVPDEGNVDILKGASGKIQNILGNSAAKFGDGGKELKGFGNFSTRGAGGLGLSGSGQGGGGDAETTLGGLGKRGTGMGRVGTGKGAAGTGKGIIGSQVRVAIRSDGPEEAVIMGSIDREAIAAAIAAHKDEFRLCYEREINAENPKLSGQIGTSFVIGASGRVTHAGIESSSLNNPNTERCVIAVLKRIEFPIPQGGGIVEVRYPFSFNSVGR